MYDKNMNAKEIERLILTTYRKEIFRPFTKAVCDYHLVNDGDHICVCISGGKDSLVMAKCMQELERHGKAKIKCEYVVMDPGFSNDNINIIKDNAEKMGIPIQIINSTIFNSVEKANHKMPCYICAKMRRGFLYDHAQKMGCNKIALGHHFDDVIETTMLSLLYNGIFNTMVPIIDSENFSGMKLIRPMYLVREENIKHFINRIGIVPSSCSCPLKKENSKRAKVKEIIAELKKDNFFVEYNLFKASENVELDHIRGYIKDKKHINIYDSFDNN